MHTVRNIIVLLVLAVLPVFSAVPPAGFLPETSGIDAEAGLTCLVTLSLPEISLSESKQEEFYDAFFYRHKQFVFGRRGSQLYFNFHDGSRWTAFIYSDADFALEANRTYQLAFTLNVHQVSSQGELWTDAVIYADGRAVGRARVMDRKPAACKLPIQFAQAQGFGSGWDCHGQFFDMRIINRALNEEEIEELAAKEKRIRFVPEGAAALPEKIRQSIEVFRKKFTAGRKDNERAFANAVTTALETWAQVCGERAFFKTFNSLEKNFDAEKISVCPEWQALRGKRTVLILSRSDNRILAWYDLTHDKNLLLAGNSPWFQAMYFREGKRQKVSGGSPEVKLSAAAKVASNDGTYRWISCYRHRDFTAKIDYSFAGDSLRYRLRIEASPGIRLHEAVFPYVKLEAHKDGDLLIPRMSGAVKRNAAANKISYSGDYPSGHVSMQLGAYYDRRSGVYFTVEDGRAQAKSLLFRAGKNGVEIVYRWPVAYPTDNNKKSVFAPQCDAVLSSFTGDWYDAGLLYKDFLRRSAVWYRSAKPVADYPEWFRTNTLWLLLVHKEDSARKLAELREYFELPFAVEYANWFGKFDRDYPHHHANPRHYLWIQDIKKMGINVVPYTNGRLWEILDRRDTDYRYTTHGIPDAVKLADGSVATEKYHGATFGAMCPACENWRNELKALAGRVIGLNVDGMYMDQIGAARPRLCFDPNHPHPAHDPDSWYMKGNRKLLLDLHKLHPQAVWTTEDNSEPYVGLMHGMLSWRWLVDGNVPLYVLLYSGRTEMVGRAFGSDTPVTRRVKILQQLLQGEQMGWCSIDFISKKNQAEFRLLVKRAMHLRLGLLDYFQKGELMRLPRISPLKWRYLQWGSCADKFVSTPDIAAVAWQLKDLKVLLIVNQDEKEHSFNLDWKPDAQWAFMSVAAESQCKFEKGRFSMKMPAGDIALILTGGNEGFAPERKRLEDLFKKIRSFERR